MLFLEPRILVKGDPSQADNLGRDRENINLVEDCKHGSNIVLFQLMSVAHKNPLPKRESSVQSQNCVLRQHAIYR